MNQQSATPKFGARRRGKYRHRSTAPEVQAITNAAAPHSEEMHHRLVKYSITMGIRMVCLGAIFVFDGWFKIIPVVGAVVLPWVAVILANGGADIYHQETVELLDEAPMYALNGSEEATDDDDCPPSDILTGEIVPDEANETEEKEGHGHL
ncbi:DUF3099 domain-containing protein [Arthrobacter sp.]|uniref:DUF3099 domain-containing protein n=1 Tax=Arthrobacter sp. TaxID=1667 RepID=UPI0026DF3268|nr:DUF3099 domain-containing protein [Arthrobacter sp.]MDO5753845.1 DUF3099 domain-containing protein [Arthrobacter sp.]